MAARLQKISVSVVLTVDRDAWDLAYGTGTDQVTIRDNVREHILNMLHELTSGNSGAGDGAITNVKPRWS